MAAAAAPALTYDMGEVYPPLTDEEKAKVAELSDLVEAQLPPGAGRPPSFAWSLEGEWRSLFLAKWLVARQWKTPDALQMLLASAAFKQERQLETAPLFPACCTVRGFDSADLERFQGVGPRKPGDLDRYYAAFRGCSSSSWHKTDKHGRLVIIDRMGQSRPAELYARARKLTPPGKPVHTSTMAAHLHRSEVGGLIGRYLVAEKKQRPAQAVVIIDCAGLSMGHMMGPAMELLKENTNVDKAYYPEGTWRCYVVNTPMVISAFWAVLKLWIDERMQKKVVFCRPNETAAKLLEVIDAESLPAFLGGKCNCEGGCVPEVTGEGGVEAADGGAVTEELTVPAGKILEKRFNVPAGSTAVWEMTVAANDVGFRVEFAPQGSPAGGKNMPIKDYGKVTSGNAKEVTAVSGEFVAPMAGTLICVMDNKHSWMKKKTVHLAVREISASGEIDNTEGASAEVGETPVCSPVTKSDDVPPADA